MLIGLIPLLNLKIPYIYSTIILFLGFVPINAFIAAIIFVFIGLVLFIGGLKASKMGKYYRYYG